MIAKSEIDAQVRSIRPWLASVSPLVAWMIVGFSILNLLIGYYLYGSGGSLTRALPIVGDIVTLKVHGSAFFLLGLTMIWGLTSNNWKLLKFTLIAGLTLKCVWMVGLFFLVANGSNPFLLMLWSFITYSQASCYVHFIPEGRRKGD